MTPTQCMVSHNPEGGTYGDCVRACVASLLDMPTEAVEHFYRDGCDAMTGTNRMTDWLLANGHAPFFVHLPGDMPLGEVLATMGECNPHVHYMLFGSTAEGGHVVIAKGGTIVHDPSWVPQGLIGPQPSGFWSICSVTRA